MNKTYKETVALWQTACLKLFPLFCKLLNDTAAFLANFSSLKSENYKKFQIFKTCSRTTKIVLFENLEGTSFSIKLAVLFFSILFSFHFLSVFLGILILFENLGVYRRENTEKLKQDHYKLNEPYILMRFFFFDK